MTKIPMFVASVLTVAALHGHAWSQDRPQGLTVGIGAGIDLPADITQPNVASVRVRLPTGITIEPRVELGLASRNVDNGVDTSGTSTMSLQLSALGRFRLIEGSAVDFLALGGVGAGFVNVNPDGDDNNTTSSVLSAVWGLSVEYWIGSRWSLSLSATNPLFSRTSTVQANPVADTSETSTAFGVIFDPNVDIMIHLYY